MGQLSKLTVTLETVTPLFLGGAEQQPELRPAPFRGALRFWLRALLGAHIGDNVERVREAENKVFGSTNGASPVIVRLTPISVPEPKSLNFSLDSGIGYLLWATTRTQRTAFPAGTTRFQLTLSVYLSRSEAHNAFHYAAGALWLLVNLGGVGMRARRGLGSLRVTDIEGWPSDFPPIQPDKGDLGSFLAKGIANLQKVLDLAPATKVNLPPSFNVLHPDTSAIYIYRQPPWENWMAALEGIGDDLRRFRRGKPPDHDGVLNVIKGQAPPPTLRRAAFGLPMQFYYRSYHEELARQHPDWNRDRRQARRKTRHLASADVTPAGRGFERRASPLHFKVVWLGEKQLTAIVTFFEAQFLDYRKVRITPREKKKKAHNVDMPDYSMVKEFLAQPHWQRVFGGS